MLIRYGYALTFAFDFVTPVLTMLDVHPSRRRDIIRIDVPRYPRGIVARSYRDAYGNICRRLIAPAGELTIEAEGLIRDSGAYEPVLPQARQVAIENLPDDVLIFLLASRYCDSDKLSAFAWKQFGETTPGWVRVQSIVDFVHNYLTFDYQRASATRSAAEALEERVGVCRDFAHLSIALCRAMSIPARYCTGYLGDIGVPKDPAPMDFSAWFEVYLDGRWYAFDARHNRPRIGRIVIGIGRDAADVAIISAFSLHRVTRFEVITEEVAEEALENAPRGRSSALIAAGRPFSEAAHSG